MQLPASSVEVEKQHSNIRLDAECKRGPPKRPTTLQMDSYVMSAFLSHQSTLEAVKEECFGSAKTKVSRVFRKARCLDTSAPAGGFVPKRKRHATRARAGRTGLLSSLLCLDCSEGG